MAVPPWVVMLDLCALAGAIAVTKLILFEGPSPRPPLTWLQVFCLMLLFLPMAPIPFAINRNVEFVGEAPLVMGLVSFIVGLGAILFARRGVARKGAPISLARRRVFIIAGPIFMLFGCWLVVQFATDLLAAPNRLSGTVAAVTGLRQYGRICFGDPDFVEIDQRWYCATRDISRQLQVGQKVEVEVSAGSHYILAVRSLVP